MSHEDFFQKALTAAGEWTRFADPKALGVLVFLSFGASDLIRNVSELFYGLPSNSSLECFTTLCFIVACGLALLTVGFVSFALFPRLKPKGRQGEECTRSLYYFGGIAEFENPHEYEQEVREKSQEELESELANQAWNVAKVAAVKHQLTQYAYWSLICFLAFWTATRIAASFIE